MPHAQGNTPPSQRFVLISWMTHSMVVAVTQLEGRVGLRKGCLAQKCHCLPLIFGHALGAEKAQTQPMKRLGMTLCHQPG